MKTMIFPIILMLCFLNANSQPSSNYLNDPENSNSSDKCDLTPRYIRFNINSNNLEQGQEINASKLFYIGKLQEEFKSPWIALVIQFNGHNPYYNEGPSGDVTQFDIEVTPNKSWDPVKNNVESSNREPIRGPDHRQTISWPMTKMCLWACGYEAKLELACTEIEPCKSNGVFSSDDDIYIIINYDDTRGWYLTYEIKPH